MTNVLQLDAIARLPMAGDNVAIATRRLEAGTPIAAGDHRFILDYTVLEGHRFAVQPIAAGEALLSWHLPFGVALRAIEPGAYVCNTGMLDALRIRRLDFALPAHPNFADRIPPYRLDELSFHAAEPVPRYDHRRTFMGYRRSPSRGVGTRNTIVLLGTTSRTGGYVQQLAHRLQPIAAGYPNIDGIVPVAHTEGGVERPNNLELLLRTLAGFMVHPNVGAVLAVDYGLEPVTNRMLRDYLAAHHYPLDDVPHHFLSLIGGFQADLNRGEAIVKGWLDRVNRVARTEESVAHLKIALQCGGSDAFSGISGNPLAAWVAAEVIRYGGAANLAETDELIGAESYVLQKVKDVATARKFLGMVARFKERVAWHGSSAEGNPSGGNKFRGLYNITLKSIGAAMKRPPEVRLDEVIEYGERMRQPGFYFMDSPGNDLESVAGQVAAGCNLIFFITGNGSITNFPFVPTLKIVTTSRRYQLLSREMDVNAGLYLDGRPMAELGRQMFDLTLTVASGSRSVGEQAGHSQVQIWRDWWQTDASQLDRLLAAEPPGGASIPIKLDRSAPAPQRQFPMFRTDASYTTDQVGLILPTSLCAGQIARMTADRLNQKGLGREQQLSRFVSLVHTEGCGNSGGSAEALYIRTLLGYLTHPLVKHGLLLEHGCEKTHNDFMRQQLEQIGLDPRRFGWASVQLDGGIDRVMHKIEAWFTAEIAASDVAGRETAGLEALRLGLVSAGPISATAAHSLARLTQAIVGAGGTVVVPEKGGLLINDSYLDSLMNQPPLTPSLSYGQRPATPGFHLMETPSTHWVESLTGLGATGVEVIVAYVGEHPLQSHPLIPVLQITAEAAVQQRFGDDMDLWLTGDSNLWAEHILDHIIALITHRATPKLYRQGNIDFQITRGLLGISL
ncbi:MAG: UxaA family hydrolase [Anaerolineae bacterium]|nr:UxaA family hydrolase [Anaerolineae bacterium]